MQVVPINEGRPSFRDIVGWLRRVADEIEAKGHADGDAELTTLLLLEVDAAGELHSRCFGDNPSRAEVVGLYQMAAIKSATGSWGIVMHGRRKPYTEHGIKRLPCARCSKPASQQWQICSDDRLHRPICDACDIALNRLVLRWMGFKDWREKMRRYIDTFTR